MPYRVNARPAQAPEPDPTPVLWERETRLVALALQASVFLALLTVTMLSAFMVALCIAAVFL